MSIFYSAHTLIKMSKEAREAREKEEQKKAQEQMLKYVPHFWDALVVAAGNGEKEFSIRFSSLEYNEEWIKAFLDRNDFVYTWNEQEDNSVILTISLVEGKNPPKVPYEDFKVGDVILFEFNKLLFSLAISDILRRDDHIKYSFANNHRILSYEKGLGWIMEENCLHRYKIEFVSQTKAIYKNFIPTTGN